MSRDTNRFTSAQEYNPSGALYKLPFVGDALKNILIPKERQAQELQAFNERRLGDIGVQYQLNDKYLEEVRSAGIVGQDYTFVEEEGSMFIDKLFKTEVAEVKNPETGEMEKRYVPRHKELYEKILLDGLPNLSKTKIMEADLKSTLGDTVGFEINDVVYNPDKNTYFLVGTNYKGDTAPLTLDQTDSLNDEIAEFSPSDFNELMKIGFRTIYTQSNKRPGVVQNAIEDADFRFDNYIDEAAGAIIGAQNAGVLDDVDSMNIFNDSIAAIIAENQDPEEVAQQDGSLSPLITAEMSPEIVALIEAHNEEIQIKDPRGILFNKDPGPPGPYRAKMLKDYMDAKPGISKEEAEAWVEENFDELYADAKRTYEENRTKPEDINLRSLGTPLIQDLRDPNIARTTLDAAVQANMLQGSSLSQDDLEAAENWFSSLSTADKVGLISTGLLFIPFVGTLVGGTVKGISFTVSSIQKMKLAPKLMDLIRKGYTTPATTTVATTKAGVQIERGRRGFAAVEAAGKQDMAKRTLLEKLRYIGQGNPRLSTVPLLDDAGNVVRQVSGGRMFTTGAFGTGAGGIILSGQIEQIENERDAAEFRSRGAIPGSSSITTGTGGTEGFTAPPAFTTPQQAVAWFNRPGNRESFIQFANSQGAPNAAAQLEAAFNSLGIQDSRSFYQNAEQIVQMINPERAPDKNKLFAAILADRSGAPNEKKAEIYRNTLTALTGVDQLQFDREKDARTQRSDAITNYKTDFDSLYLPEGGFNASDNYDEIQALFQDKNWNELTSNNDMLQLRNKFSSSAFYPTYGYDPASASFVNISEQNLLEDYATAVQNGVRFNPAEQRKIERNLNEGRKLDRALTDQSMKKFFVKFTDAGIVEWLKSFVTGKTGFANPEDEIFPYVELEINHQYNDAGEVVGYDIVGAQLRQPGSGMKVLGNTRDNDFVRELGNLESQIRLSFIANLPKQNITVLNPKPEKKQ